MVGDPGMPTAIGSSKVFSSRGLLGNKKDFTTILLIPTYIRDMSLEAMRWQILVYEQGGAFTSSAFRQVLEFSGMQEVTPVIFS